MAFNFRDIEHNLCIAMDPTMSTLLSAGEDCGANAVICYGYVDKQAGLTFEVLCLASYVDGDYTIVNENKTVSMKVRSETYKDTEVIPIKNVYNFLSGLDSVLHCLISATFFFFYIADKKICAVNHISISLLDCSLEMTACGFLAKFYFIIVFFKGFCVIAVFCGLIGHNPYKRAISVKYVPFNTQDSR